MHVVPTGYIECFMGLSKGSARNAGRILQDCSGARSIEQQPETSHSLGIERRYLIYPSQQSLSGVGFTVAAAGCFSQICF